MNEDKRTLKSETGTHRVGDAGTRARGVHGPGSLSRHAEQRAHVHMDEELETTESFQLFLNQAARHSLLTAEEEVELAKGIERGDLEAKERLINSNLRLVVSQARRYQGLGLPLQDLVQEGMLGLIRATEKFDWRRGYKFSTYATLWIRQAMQRGLENTGRPIRLPAHIGQRERKVNRVQAELAVKLNRDPSDEEIAARAELPVDEVTALRDLSRVITSLDAPVGDGDATLGDLRSDETPALESEVLENERERAVREALDELPEGEREVLELRFGTGRDAPKGLREIGRRLKITEHRVRQLEEQALRRLAQGGVLDAWREAA